MSFWDGIKRIFGMGGASRGPESLLEKWIDRVVRAKIAAGSSFSDREVADESLDLATPQKLQLAIAIVERQFRDDVLALLGYVRTYRAAFGGAWVFHPRGTPPPVRAPPRPGSAPLQAPRAAATAGAPQASVPPPV